MGEDKNKKTSQDSVLEKWLSKKKNNSSSKTIPILEDGSPAPLSYGQERLWLLEQMYPGLALYNYAQLYHFSGNLNKDFLIRSFRQTALKYSVLRSNYLTENGKLVQKVTHKNVPVEEIELTQLSDEQQEKELKSKLKEHAGQSFDLSKDALFKLYLFSLGNNEYKLLLVIHHIAGDADSMSLINKDVSTYYQSLTAGNDLNIEEPTEINYRDYAAWERSKEIKTTVKDYWLNKLSGELPVTELPQSINKPSNPYAGSTLKINLPTQLSDNLKQLARQTGATMYVLTLTAWKILMAKYCRQEDVIVGSPFSTRDVPVLEKQVGFFNETLVLRSHIDQHQSFKSLLEEVKKTTNEALVNKQMPFDLLVNQLNAERVAGKNPLFQTMFLYNQSAEKLNLGEEVEIEEEMLDLEVAKFELTLFVNDKGSSLELAFEHSNQYDNPFVKTMAIHFEELLNGIVAEPEKPISKVSILPEHEQQKILFDWNKTDTSTSFGPNIHHLIKEQVAAHPNEVAVSFEGKTLSYPELDLWSNQIAERLILHGLSKDEIVGLYVNRSIEMVVGILGILKAGGAYLPLDPSYPKDRINYMLSDTAAKIVLVNKRQEQHIFKDAKHILSLEKDPNYVSNTEINFPEITPQNGAYVIYTSGSTGNPKGVLVTHQNLIHSTTSRYQFYDNQPGNFLLLSSFSFDSSIVGIFWTLCKGGTLVLPAERLEQDIEQLSQLIEKNKVTHTLLLPGLYQTLLDYISVEKLKSLEVVMLAGEACSIKLCHKHFNKLQACKLYNEYGPTEASVWCVAHQIKEDELNQPIPIGKPIPGAEAYILDQHLNPVPIGIKGELFIGGTGITNGYLNNKSLTSQKFINNPFAEGRLYKTGDLASYRKDGVIEFHGRADQQVKIRGFRVELEEIKENILNHASVNDAIVLVKEEEERKRLIAYLKSSEKDFTGELKKYLKDILPEYMIPSEFIIVSAFPKLPNGKINLKLLPESASVSINESNYVPPKSELQKKITAIWGEVLAIEQVGIKDNFFDIGGDSILSIRVVAKLNNEGIDIGPTQIFENQTIEQLADSIENKTQENTDSSIVTMKPDGDKSPLFCLHSGGAHVLFYRGLAKYIDKDRPVYAIQPAGLDGKEEYDSSIEEMAVHYIKEMKKVQPNGPYHLLGTCFGNAVGLEMIHRLKAEGEDIASFYVVDSAPAYLIPPSPNGERKPVSRMLAMIGKGDWNGISKKFRNRYIRYNRKRNFDSKSQVEKDLDEMIDSLNTIYVKYTWKPVDVKITLIRTSEFSSRKNKQFHIDHWKMLSNNQLEIFEIEGHHLTIFEEPEVKGLAKLVSKHLSEKEVISSL